MKLYECRTTMVVAERRDQAIAKIRATELYWTEEDFEDEVHAVEPDELVDLPFALVGFASDAIERSGRAFDAVLTDEGGHDCGVVLMMPGSVAAKLVRPGVVYVE